MSRETLPAAPSPSVVGQLLSVSVGLPRPVSWQGRTVRTAVWKRPVAGPQIVRRLNIDGDGQGDLKGHGGPNRAVMVYQAESYAHWRGYFGRDDLEHGNFGENFTVEGLADDTVCIGDQFEIGTALFEVTQPRVTCYRVGLRLGEPQLPALLVSHRRPGFYLRVLREGVVEAGDRVVQVGSGPEHMSVAEVDALLYLPGHDRSGVARALKMPALSPGWRDSFESILAAADSAAGNAGLVAADPAPPAWSGFRQMRIVDVIRESDTVVSLRLTQADGLALPAPLPGQFIALSFHPGGSDRAVVRNYSLSGPPKAGDYRVSVKLEQHGIASNYVHHDLEPGALVDAAAPRGPFTLDDGDWPVLLVSAGIGATPVLAMLYTLAQARSDRDIWWLHGARNSAEHPFAAEVSALLGRLPKAHAVIAYSAPLPSDEPGRDYTHTGRLAATALETLSLPLDAAAYICGPGPFMDEMTAALTGLGIAAARVHTEAFGPGAAVTPGIAAGPTRAPHQPDGGPGVGADIQFSRSGLTVSWREDFASLLELAEACDVPTRWSCRTGVCHTCESGMLAGAVVYDPAPIELPGPGSVLLCCSKPSADLVLDL